MSTRIAPGVVQIDTRLGGWGEVTAGYLVEGPEPCLVETGSQSSLPTVLAELDALGLGPLDEVPRRDLAPSAEQGVDLHDPRGDARAHRGQYGRIAGTPTSSCGAAP